MRLDNYLVEEAHALSRNKAQEMIKSGVVLVNQEVMLKPSCTIGEGDKVTLLEHKSYLSRAAFKLSSFLEEIALDVSSLEALDIGASTGGFTQVLLEAGVKGVCCVDVGRDQLHPSLREDTRVVLFEQCDIREFEPKRRFDLVVSDVSFISLLHIIDAVDRLACGDIILLFKPQYEVGKDAKRDNHGVVIDEKAILKAMIRFEDACELKGWNLIRKSPSKLTGKEGNLEYCYYFKKS